jgi:hypothetical protein
MTFDAVFGTLAPAILALFTEELARMTRTVHTVSDSTGLTSVSSTTASVRMSPPQPVDYKLVNGDSVLATDFVAYFAAKDLDDVAFVYTPAANVHISVQFRSREYRAIAFRVYPGGDTDALIEVQLRS